LRLSMSSSQDLALRELQFSLRSHKGSTQKGTSGRGASGRCWDLCQSRQSRIWIPQMSGIPRSGTRLTVHLRLAGMGLRPRTSDLRLVPKPPTPACVPKDTSAGRSDSQRVAAVLSEGPHSGREAVQKVFLSPAVFQAGRRI
jgi:hypothetical protein